MTASDTRPDGIPLPETAGRLRPVDRRVVQAIALVCLMSAILVVQWADETDKVRRFMKPPERVTTVPEGQIGDLAGAKWKIFGRRKARPLGNRQGDVVELRLDLAVRPGDAASAKAVGSYGLLYRLHDDDGHEWSATGLRAGEPKPGVAMRITIRGTVPRTKADALELEIQAPKETRREESPLALLRFAR